MNQSDIRIYIILAVAGIAMAISHYYQKRKTGSVNNKKVMAWFYRVLGAAVIVGLVLAAIGLLWRSN